MIIIIIRRRKHELTISYMKREGKEDDDDEEEIVNVHTSIEVIRNLYAPFLLFPKRPIDAAGGISTVTS